MTLSSPEHREAAGDRTGGGVLALGSAPYTGGAPHKKGWAVQLPPHPYQTACDKEKV